MVRASRVYIVLVNWNGWHDSIECLESLLRLGYPDYRIIVCDNDSSDGSVERILQWAEGSLSHTPAGTPLARFSTPACPKPVECRVAGPEESWPDLPCATLTVLRTGANLGFAGGNNVGIRFARRQGDGAFFWLLNNDTVAAPDALDHLVARALAEDNPGIVGSTLFYYHRPDTVQALGGACFSKYRGRSRLIGLGRQWDEIPGETLRRVEQSLHWVSGASMLVSAPFCATIGLMEERYFLYFEELDWSIRAKGRFGLGYASGSVVYHKQGSATNEVGRSATSIYYKVRSRLKLYRKLLPAYLPFCLAATALEALVARKDRRGLRTMWRAMADEFCREEKS
ncbi:MAG: hypothetical protein A2075_11490 [Geobacteraceae bacterium GWC2_58_44]|nr:MAG: hypothetical protein A2075_11490 [Geobacteraceae bacterium GWC2_58_44]